MPLHLNVLCGLDLQPRGPAYTLVQLLLWMQSDELHPRVFTPVMRWESESLPFPVESAATGILSIDQMLPLHYLSSFIRKRNEHRFLSKVAKERMPQAVYTWSEVSSPVIKKIKELDVFLVREKFNCAKATSRSILRDAYAKLGVKDYNVITERAAEQEVVDLQYADIIFSPSPLVTKSLLDVGLASEQIIQTSYGWVPSRFASAKPALPQYEGITLVFAGDICVRKGAHILLDAWKKANIKGRLVLVGAIEPIITELYKTILGRDDVFHVPFTTSVGDYFLSADWFVFPSLEEGSPQVIYEAIGCGTPVIVSPMGAGAVVRNGREGIVVDSDNFVDWAEILITLPERCDDQRSMAASAAARSLEYTYDKIGFDRRAEILSRFTS